ncbi:MAG: hypothetical protein CME28_05720 [Gemmatimonadetes bacterium]|nr:hypothetical protein [Gemmatimonadota bacterium]
MSSPQSPSTDIRPLLAGEAVTVAATVHATEAQTESLQPIVSQWQPQLAPRFSAYDATNTDGLICSGYYGAVFDGRHVYACPIRSHRERASVHGHVLRCDTQGDFHDPSTWEAYDAGGTDKLNTVCYYGAAFDGRHVIFAPRDDSNGYHSRILRYDTQGPFKEADAWSAFDADLPHSAQGTAYDGQHVYFCPGYESVPGQPMTETILSGKVMRMDTSTDFKDAASYSVFDTTALGPEAVCFDGGAFDGRFVYFVPLLHGVVVRYDTQGSFEDAASWDSFDARTVGIGMNVGAVFDGRWLYFCAYGHASMVRYDTRKAFADRSSWEQYDAAYTDGIDTGGFDGGFFDGRYITFCPWTRSPPPGEPGYHCNYLRYDTTQPFHHVGAWSAYDASSTDGLESLGYNAGAFDGRSFYAAPLYAGDGKDFHGRMMRVDTLGENGAFSLRFCDYGHNGGLCAAVPGPSFLVNTASGVRSVATHQPLPSGVHHLVGVYDGASLQLWVNGRLLAQRAAQGHLLTPNLPVTFGQFDGGGARFGGQIEDVVVAPEAWTPTQIQRAFDQLRR